MWLDSYVAEWFFEMRLPMITRKLKPKEPMR